MTRNAIIITEEEDSLSVETIRVKYIFLHKNKHTVINVKGD